LEDSLNASPALLGGPFKEQRKEAPLGTGEEGQPHLDEAWEGMLEEVVYTEVGNSFKMKMGTGQKERRSVSTAEDPDKRKAWPVVLLEDYGCLLLQISMSEAVQAPRGQRSSGRDISTAYLT
jgi:hypothetical protein